MPRNAAAVHRTTFMVMHGAANARWATLHSIDGATRKTRLAQTVQQIARRSAIVTRWWNDDDILPLGLGVGELRNRVVSLGNVVILDVWVLVWLFLEREDEGSIWVIEMVRISESISVKCPIEI